MHFLGAVSNPRADRSLGQRSAAPFYLALSSILLWCCMIEILVLGEQGKSKYGSPVLNYARQWRIIDVRAYDYDLVDARPIASFADKVPN